MQCKMHCKVQCKRLELMFYRIFNFFAFVSCFRLGVIVFVSIYTKHEKFHRVSCSQLWSTVRVYSQYISLDKCTALYYIAQEETLRGKRLKRVWVGSLLVVHLGKRLTSRRLSEEIVQSLRGGLILTLSLALTHLCTHARLEISDSNTTVAPFHFQLNRA